jgi:outer membrane biogenesis lipoprotein LolB
MSQAHTPPNASHLMQLAGICVLMLAACSRGYIEEPWSGNDPQWKQSHFASQIPDAQLRERAALTQIDR